MVDTGRPGKEVIAAMAEKNVYIGRVWPVWPTYVRITVGTRSEMDKFQHGVERSDDGAGFGGQEMEARSDARRSGIARSAAGNGAGPVQRLKNRGAGFYRPVRTASTEEEVGVAAS